MGHHYIASRPAEAGDPATPVAGKDCALGIARKIDCSGRFVGAAESTATDVLAGRGCLRHGYLGA